MPRCKLISLDTSSSETGYAIFEDAYYASSGILSPDKKLKGQPKMDDMCKRIVKLLTSENPDIVIIERMSVGRNVATARMLAEIIGVVYGWCLSHEGVYYEELTPSQWRGYLGIQGKGKREELKQVSIDYVNDHGIKVKSDNEADAICIGFAYIVKTERMIDQ